MMGATFRSENSNRHPLLASSDFSEPYFIEKRFPRSRVEKARGFDNGAGRAIRKNKNVTWINGIGSNLPRIRRSRRNGFKKREIRRCHDELPSRRIQRLPVLRD